MGDVKNQGGFLYEQVAAELAELIRLGTFRPGERIPSVRQLSRQRKISITTVLQAYMLLENQGLIETRPQSGYYVRTRLPEELPEPETSNPVQDPTLVSVRELVMMVLKDSTNPNLIQRLERVVGQNLAVNVGTQELFLGIVP